MIFPLRVHFVAMYFEPCHFPPENEFSSQKHCVSPDKRTFSVFLSGKTRVFDFRKVFVRGNSMAKMKYQHNTAATNASCRRARLTCFVYAI